jgi:hypothetical protein
MRSTSRFMLLALAVLVAVLVLAVPAMAASNVAKGDSQLTVPKNMVYLLQTKAMNLVPASQVTYKPVWSSSSKSLTWFYDAPIWIKPIKQSGVTYYTNYSTKAGTGTFYHNFQWFWVRAGSPMAGLKWQGIRIQANSKTSYNLIATVGNQAPYTTATVATSTAATKITHSGKKYQINGLKFTLTTAAANQIAAATGVAPATNTPLFTGAIFFTMK